MWLRLQDLGHNHPKAAKRSTMVGLTVIFIIVGILGVIVAMLPAQLAQIFSQDQVIIDFFVDIRYPMAVVMVRLFRLCGGL